MGRAGAGEKPSAIMKQIAADGISIALAKQKGGTIGAALLLSIAG